MTTPKRTGNRKEQNTERPQDSGEETHMTDIQNSNKNREENNEMNANGKKDNEKDKSNKEDNNNNNRGYNRGGRNGRGGRGGRGGRRTERKLAPSTEWETYKFSISFNRTPANAAYLRHGKGVLFLKGHISLKNWTYCPLFSHVQRLSSARAFLLG
jgi:hypothetical protein